MPSESRIEKYIKALSVVSSRMAMILLLALAALVTLDVILRFSINRPIRGAFEVSELLLLSLIFLGFGYTHGQGGNIDIDLITSHFNDRVRVILRRFFCVLILICLFFVMWYGVNLTIRAWQAKLVTDVLRIPLFPFKFIVPLGVFILFLEVILQLLETFKKRGDDR